MSFLNSQLKFKIKKNISFFLRNIKSYCHACKTKNKNFVSFPKDIIEEKINIYNVPWIKKVGNKYQFNVEMFNFETYSCSICNSSDRERLYAMFIEYIEFENFLHVDSKILHLAPERGLQKLLKKKYKNYVDADLYMDDVLIKNCNIHRLPFYNESFDFIICSHVLEHVDDDIKALNEINRVLKKSGIAIIMVPIILMDENFEDEEISNSLSKYERINRFGQIDHVRTYSPIGFKKKLLNNFHIKIFDENNFGKKFSKKCGFENFKLYICSKKL